MHRSILVLAPMVLLSALSLRPATAQVVAFTEDWESRAIDPARWSVRSGQTAVMRVEDISGDGSDHALLMWAGPDFQVWTSSIRTRFEFSREQVTILEASLWGDPSRTDGTYTYPHGASWMLGFFAPGEPGAAPFEQIEAAMDDWYLPPTNPRLRFSQPPSASVFEGDGSAPQLSQAFMDRMSTATGKATALRVRITLATDRGARFEWRDGTDWVTEVDTLGASGGTAQHVRLGFAPVGAAVFIDDIEVKGLAVLREDWNDVAGDEPEPDCWRYVRSNSLLQLTPLDASDKALLMWWGDGGGWQISVKSRLGWGRNQPLVTEATLWGETTLGSDPFRYPSGAGWLFGFHKWPVPTQYAFEDLAAALDHYVTDGVYGDTDNYRFSQGPEGSTFQGRGSPVRLSAELTAAIRAATSKANGVRVRVTLGSPLGARFEWWDGDEWILERDTIGVSGSTDDPVVLGFGPTQAPVFIDDILVKGSIVDLPTMGPDDFPRFHFPDAPEQQRRLDHYLAYFFLNRPRDTGKVLFNKEYLTIADLWLGGAWNEIRTARVQDFYRTNLLGIGIDADGYVHTHQHFSHAHERGWPFPMWTQAGAGFAGCNGWTAGWHFADDGEGWVWGYLKGWGDTRYYTAAARNGWTLERCTDGGVVNGRWVVHSNGFAPALTTPDWMVIDADNAPFLQLRWTRTGTIPPGGEPRVQWKREGDADFSSERQVSFTFNGNPEYEAVSGVKHSLIEMYSHPLWDGKITALRLQPAPGEQGVTFEIDSFFTCYDTRHRINNPLFVIASWEYYRWTGDVDFLRQNIERMRTALRYMQERMGGLANNFIKVDWSGHDGRSGIVYDPGKRLRPGVGIGGNYYDLVPFGGDNAYATNMYHRTLRIMADVEQAIRDNPDWGIAAGPTAFDPGALNGHADQVRATARSHFWNAATGRFHGAIDSDGLAHDYGFTFLNLDSIWYDVADPAQARSIMDWLNGDRVVAGDTSTGDDIYHWRLGPRATTRRNVDWYVWAWSAPESIPWGFQIQDGGAVLGFSFHDLWARIHVLGPDNAWQRLTEILDWDREVWDTAGGYRPYYETHEGSLQGGGTPGGIGIDFEFYESSMLPAIIPYGFLGMQPRATDLLIAPRLPSQAPELGVRNLLYRGTPMDVVANAGTIVLTLHERPATPLQVTFTADRRRLETGEEARSFRLRAAGTHTFATFESAVGGWRNLK